MGFFDSLFGSIASMITAMSLFGLPIVAIVMFYTTKMNKDKRQKEIRQLIIENKTDPEIAKLLIDEPKKADKTADSRFQTLRAACVLLGVGLGALINWLVGSRAYFWFIIAFGIGVGLLCSFFAEMYLKKQQNNTSEPSNEP